MVSQQLIEIIIKATDEASATAEKVDSSIRKIGDSTNSLGKTSSAFDGIKTKLSSVASTIDGKFGGALTKAKAKFDSLKGTVTNVATSIKSKFGAAIDQCRAKMNTFQTGMKSLSGGFGFLKSAASMATGMIGFELMNGLVEAGRAAINASYQLDYFTGRLGMSEQQVSQFKGEIGEMQKEFRKVDMTSVAATASDISARMDLPISKLGDVTRMTAVMSSEFVRNGRTQEDAILAVADAMDGQFKRLQEIGITEDTLMKNGWNGDLEDKAGLVDALNKSMQDLGYEDIAKDITTLDEAFGALSIAGGQLLTTILVPITPALVGIVEGLLGLGDAISGLPDWALIAGGITAIGLAALFVAPLIGSTLMSALVSFGTMVGVTIIPEMATLSGALLTVAGAAWAAVAPFLPFIVAAVAVAVAIYEVGKAFGWWTDVGSMIDAISTGLQRMWNHFVNHPDVQAAIQMISNAISTLWSWIQQAGQAVLEFFGITSSGNFDIVLAIMEGLGAAWDLFKWKIGIVITVVTTLWNVMTTVFNAIWSVVGPIIMQIAGLVMNLIGAFDQFKNGQINLPQLIMTVLTLLANTYMNIFTYIGGLVVKFGRMLLARGLAAARGFVMAIVNWVRQLPGRVYSLLLQVVSRIRSAIQAWITAASKKVSDLITNITSPFSGVASSISSALSGVVNTITAPFKAAWDKLKPLIDKIKDGMKLIGAAGGETAAGGEIATDTSTGGLFNVATGQYVSGENKLVIEDNINLTLDLQKVPAHISTGQLIEALNNKEVLNALVTNRDFQSLDATVKQRISLKNSRSGH